MEFVTEKDRALILLTNDDGYESPALHELAKQISDIGEVLIVAPKEHHSGVARGIPFGEKARKTGTIEKHVLSTDDGAELVAYSVDGTPALSVVHGVLEIAQRKPDLCISGINYGENVGRALNYSGTIGAAIEAADFGIPSIAISQQLNYDDIFYMEGAGHVFAPAARIAKKIAQRVLLNKPKEDFYCLNVNVPHRVSNNAEFEITRQAHVSRWVWVNPKKRDFDQHFAFEYEEVQNPDWQPGTDAHALLINKNVSITPISWSIDASEDEYDYLAIKDTVIAG